MFVSTQLSNEFHIHKMKRNFLILHHLVTRQEDDNANAIPSYMSHPVELSINNMDTLMTVSILLIC